jgi:threonine/homoserine/homoserine lactone efflux protein
MDQNLMLRGLILGFSIAAPVGPIGVLCIRRTLAEGRLSGLVSGLGAATADAIYCSVAAFGLVVIVTPLVRHEVWLGLAGGLFLCGLGTRTFLSRPPEALGSASERGLLGSYFTALALTLANPTTILSFAAILTGAGVTESTGRVLAAAPLVLGVFLGSTLWWLVLSSTVALLRSRVDAGALLWINRLSGVVILGFGLLSLVRAL